MSAENPRQRNLASNRELFDQLMSQFVDSAMSPEDRADLVDIVSQNDEHLERFVDLVVLDTLLREENGPESIVELVDLVHGDAPANLARTPVHRTWPQNRIAGLATLAALLILVVAFFRVGDASHANAASIVRAAINAAGQNIERVYVLEVTKGDAFSPEIARSARIATQGDRFWVQMNRGDQSFAWGRMNDDSIWLAQGASRAILLASDEIGEPLQQIADTFSLKTQSLLQDLVSHCELESSKPDELTHRIVAVPRSGQRRRLQRAVVDVDLETKTVRQLTIQRRFADGHTSTQTFTHVVSRPSDESLFRPEGHLRGDSKILDRNSSPDQRAEILFELFGSAASEWLKTSN